MSTLYNNKHKWGVYGRSYMFSDNKNSIQYGMCIAGKFLHNRKRQAHLNWKSVGRWYARDYHIFD